MDQEVKRKFLKAGEIGRKALEFATTLIEPGTSFYEVAEQAEKFIRDEGAKPSFPLNLSINNEAAHFTPAEGDKKKFRRGDLVKVDLGAEVDGYPSDNATTVEVGETGNYTDLIDATREALNSAIRRLRPMLQARQIGAEIGRQITNRGFKPIRNLGGHGINRYDLHSSIFIPNYDDGNAAYIKPDTVIAIEPFASTGIGMVHNGPPGNIYILSGTKNDSEETIYKNFNTLPFAERWLAKIEPDYRRYIKRMMSSSQVSAFPVLKEHSSARISQAEHTVMILSDEIVVTTK